MNIHTPNNVLVTPLLVITHDTFKIGAAEKQAQWANIQKPLALNNWLLKTNFKHIRLSHAMLPGFNSASLPGKLIELCTFCFIKTEFESN